MPKVMYCGQCEAWFDSSGGEPLGGHKDHEKEVTQPASFEVALLNILSGIRLELERVGRGEEF